MGRLTRHHVASAVVAIWLGCSACFTNPIFNQWPQDEPNSDLQLGLALIVWFTPFLTNGRTWTNHQLVVDIGAQGLLDANGAADPSVVKVGSTYHMWYDGTDGSGDTRILYANSVDGLTWSNHQLAVDLGASTLGYDVNRSYGADVYHDGSVFKMFYSGESGGNVRILYAESLDGVNWSNFSLAINLSAIGAGVDDQYVFNSTTNGNRVWYTVANTGLLYRVATCDGANVPALGNCQISIGTGNEGTYDTNNVAAGAVFLDKNAYKTWYAGSTSSFDYDIIYCESLDGVGWSGCLRSIERNTLGIYDTRRVIPGTVMAENGVGKMWYFGADAGNTTRIFFAESH